MKAFLMLVLCLIVSVLGFFAVCIVLSIIGRCMRRDSMANRIRRWITNGWIPGNLVLIGCITGQKQVITARKAARSGNVQIYTGSWYDVPKYNWEFFVAD